MATYVQVQLSAVTVPYLYEYGIAIPSGIKVKERVPRLLFGVRVHTLIPVFLDFDTGTERNVLGEVVQIY